MRLSAVILAIGLAGGIAVVGCHKDKDDKKKPSKQEDEKRKNVRAKSKDEVKQKIKDASAKAAKDVNEKGGNVTATEQQNFANNLELQYDKAVQAVGEE